MLTSAGLERLRTAAGTHLDGVRRYFLGRFDAADLDAIERSLGRIAAALEPETRPASEGRQSAEA